MLISQNNININTRNYYIWLLTWYCNSTQGILGCFSTNKKDNFNKLILLRPVSWCHFKLWSLYSDYESLSCCLKIKLHKVIQNEDCICRAFKIFQATAVTGLKLTLAEVSMVCASPECTMSFSEAPWEGLKEWGQRIMWRHLLI